MAKKPVPAKKTEAAKTPKVNKSQSIRDYLKDHPGTANKEVAEALTKQGIKLSADYVATVKGQMNAKKGKRKRRQTAATAMSVKTGVGIPEIKAAFALLKHCGSLTVAKEALAAAVDIQKIL
jgi:uncharacterized protein YneF (UPF0154 family)